MPSLEWLRTFGPVLLALVAAMAVDRLTERKGLLPPAFCPPGGEMELRSGFPLRRLLALGVVWGVLWVGVFSPLGLIGQGAAPDLDQLETPQLFLLHALFVLALGSWYLLGFAGTASDRRGTAGVQFGFRSAGLLRELGLGLVAGIGAWLLVIGFLLFLGALIWKLGGEEMLPAKPPAVIPWIAALPVGLRLALSLSAGVVEETFFRGFLQPRVGITLSTLLFVLAHASYEEPLMLVGVTLLSIVYALLVRWRQNIWPAIAAHTLFDALQLLVVIPTALDFLPAGREEILTPVATAGLRWTAGLIC